MVCNYPEGTDTAAKSTNNVPADKAEVEQEESHLMTVHKSAALVDALLPCPIGVIVLEIEAKSVGIALNDTGDHEKQGPKIDKQGVKKSEKEVTLEILERMA